MMRTMTRTMMLMLATFCWLMAGSISGYAQDEMTVRIATFGKQASFVAERDSIKLRVVEAGQQFDPETMEIEAIDQIIVAIDTSDSMKYLLPDLLKQLKKALPERQSVPMMIVTFDEDVKVVTDFTTSRATLESGMERVKAGKHSTQLYRAIENLQQLAGTRRTHLLLVTDGSDSRAEKINIAAIVGRARTTISYINWGIGDPSLKVDEPGYQAAKKSEMIKRAPNSLLSQLAQASGGDVMNFTEWKSLNRYFQTRFSTGSFLYRVFWHTDNPERKFNLVAADGSEVERLAKR